MICQLPIRLFSYYKLLTASRKASTTPSTDLLGLTEDLHTLTLRLSTILDALHHSCLQQSMQQLKNSFYLPTLALLKEYVIDTVGLAYPSVKTES